MFVHSKKHAYNTLFHLKYPFDSRILTSERICMCWLLWQVGFPDTRWPGNTSRWDHKWSLDHSWSTWLMEHWITRITGSQGSLDHNEHWITGITRSWVSEDHKDHWMKGSLDHMHHWITGSQMDYWIRGPKRTASEAHSKYICLEIWNSKRLQMMIWSFWTGRHQQSDLLRNVE